MYLQATDHTCSNIISRDKGKPKIWAPKILGPCAARTVCTTVGSGLFLSSVLDWAKNSVSGGERRHRHCFGILFFKLDLSHRCML
jgi:hypothetical protein